MRRTGRARLLRGIIAGPLTTFLALLFHVLGGGQAPGPLALAVCVFAVTWATVLIGRARPSLPLLVVAVAVAQVVLHTAFAMTTGSAVLVEAEHTSSAGHASAALVVSAVHGGGAMWIAHVLAGVLTVVLVRRAERILRGLVGVARLTARTVARGVLIALASAGAVIAPQRPAPSSTAWERPARPAAFRPGTVLVRRGPPALVG